MGYCFKKCCLDAETVKKKRIVIGWSLKSAEWWGDQWEKCVIVQDAKIKYNKNSDLETQFLNLNEKNKYFKKRIYQSYIRKSEEAFGRFTWNSSNDIVDEIDS